MENGAQCVYSGGVSKILAVLGLLGVAAGLWLYLFSTQIHYRAADEVFKLKMGAGKWVYYSGLMAAMARGRGGGEVTVVIKNGIENTGKCITVARGTGPLYCLRVAGEEITLLVDQRVWDKVGQDKARLGANLLLGEALYSRVGGDKERYWRLYNRWQSQMWRVEQR